MNFVLSTRIATTSLTRKPSGMVNAVLEMVGRVEHQVERVGRPHLLLELVVADLDVRVAARRLDERLDGLDHALVLQGPADVGDRVALLHLEEHPAATRPGVVRRRSRTGRGESAPCSGPTWPGHEQRERRPARRGSRGRRSPARRRSGGGDPEAGLHVAQASWRTPNPRAPRVSGRSWHSSRAMACDDLARSHPRGAFGVQRLLQDHHGGGLVDHRAPLAALAPTVAQHSLRGDRGQALVTQPDRDRGNPAASCRANSRTLAAAGPSRAGQRPGQADDDLDGLVLGGQAPRSGPGRPCRGRRSRPAWPGSRTGRCARHRSGRRRGRRRGAAVPHARSGPRRRRGRPRPRRRRAPASIAGRVGAAALRDVVLAAALAVEQRADGPDQRRWRRRPAPGPRR